MAREMRRRALLPLLCLALVLPAGAAGAAKQSWAQREIRLVTSRGLMGANAATFKPDAPLTQQALSDLVAGLTDKEPAAPADPSTPVTMAKLDSKLVAALD